MKRKILRILSFIGLLITHPLHIPKAVWGLAKATWKNGTMGAKAFIHTFNILSGHDGSWWLYKRHFSPGAIEVLSRSLAALPRQPLISVLIPTYNTPPDLLDEAMASVLAQWYSHWQAVVVDDGSSDTETRACLQKWAETDPRIKVEFGSRRGNIAATTNTALNLARGDYVVLLDHDDLLEPQALGRLAQAAVLDDADFIYSDESLIDEDGKHTLAFFFRPAFSWEKLRTHPYIVHVVCFRAEMLRRLGGFDETLTISQDYDLILRAAEASRVIVHIPEILYRWRDRSQSAGHDKQMQVSGVSRRVIASHLQRVGLKATVSDGLWFNFYRVDYALDNSAYRVAIVIPTKNRGDLLRQCIDSLRKTILKANYQIIVINHQSDDPQTVAYLERLHAASDCRVIDYVGPFNFSSINNFALSRLEEEFSHYLLCNNDVEALEEGWLERMLALGQHADVGAVGATLYYADKETIQHAGVCVGFHGMAEHYGKWMKRHLDDGRIHPGYIGSLIAVYEMSAVTAACMLVRADAWAKVSGFDERLAVGFGDVDFCLRLRKAGYRILFCPEARLLHYESISRGKSRADPHPDDSQFFHRRWIQILTEGDPYYSPNLATDNTHWGILHPIVWRSQFQRRVYLQHEHEYGRIETRCSN